MENIKEIVAEFKGRVNIEVRKQEKLDIAEEKTLEGRSYQGNIQQRYCMDRMIESLKMNI